jgi:hypothetical protein
MTAQAQSEGFRFNSLVLHIVTSPAVPEQASGRTEQGEQVAMKKMPSSFPTHCRAAPFFEVPGP